MSKALPWSVLECYLIIADYMAMFFNELKQQKYSKAEHRRKLLPHLNSRTEGSIEFKHQNISAVLIELGYPYIIGYKPAYNYQGLLKTQIESYLVDHGWLLAQQAESTIAREVKLAITDWSNVVESPPEHTVQTQSSRVREYTPRLYNYSEREQSNRQLGMAGEEFVFAYEQFRLKAAGRDDLAKELEWTSRDKGDGAGYDIRSFEVGDNKDDAELFIEVKATRSGKWQPFFISDNEVAFSEEHSDQYSLYRVFQLGKNPGLFMLPGSVRGNVNLEAKTYRASF